MQQTLLPCKLQAASGARTQLTSFGGIPLVVEMFRALGLDRVVARALTHKQQGWTETSLLESLIALQVAGGECMDDIERFADDAGKALAGYAALPSASAVRRFLHRFDAGVSDPRALGSAVVPDENAPLQALNDVHRHVVRRLLDHAQPRWITVDADATVICSEKQSCLGTYKGGTGYQPIQAIWAEKQVVIAEEFRDGNVPAQFRALEFLKKCRRNLPPGMQFSLRSDGAWYQWEVMAYCTEHGIPFSITADLSQGLLRFVHALPDAAWTPLMQITAKGVEPTDRECAELAFSSAALAQDEIRQRLRGYRAARQKIAAFA